MRTRLIKARFQHFLLIAQLASLLSERGAAVRELFDLVFIAAFTLFDDAVGLFLKARCQARNEVLNGLAQ